VLIAQVAALGRTPAPAIPTVVVAPLQWSKPELAVRLDVQPANACLTQVAADQLRIAVMAHVMEAKRMPHAPETARLVRRLIAATAHVMERKTRPVVQLTVVAAIVAIKLKSRTMPGTQPSRLIKTAQLILFMKLIVFLKTAGRFLAT